MSDICNIDSCSEDYDDELFNQCAEIEEKLSQPENEGDVIILSEDSSTSSTVIVQELQEAELEQIHNLPIANVSTNHHKTFQRRKMMLRNAAVHNMKMELRWYRKEKFREKEYHAREMRRIQIESKRINLENKRYRILGHLMYSLTRILPKCYRLKHNVRSVSVDQSRVNYRKTKENMN